MFYAVSAIIRSFNGGQQYKTVILNEKIIQSTKSLFLVVPNTVHFHNINFRSEWVFDPDTKNFLGKVRIGYDHDPTKGDSEPEQVAILLLKHSQDVV